MPIRWKKVGRADREDVRALRETKGWIMDARRLKVGEA